MCINLVDASFLEFNESAWTTLNILSRQMILHDSIMVQWIIEKQYNKSSPLLQYSQVN